MNDFQELYQPRHGLVGADAIKQIPFYINRFGGHKGLVISDEGLVKIGTVGKVTELLQIANMPFVVYTGVKPNPTVAIVNEAAEFGKENKCDYIIAIGGGSPLDVGKAVAILATNGGDIRRFEGVNLSEHKAFPLIAVNTTAGTGSEVTRDYVITDENTHRKMLMVDNHALANVAINDPKLMTGLPPHLTAATGMDALTHAIEAYTCKQNIPYANGLAFEAIHSICHNHSLERAVSNGNDLAARTDMCWAEYMAGLAFSNSGLGLVHAMAHQLGGYYNMPHGVANAILLPYVMEYNSSVCMDRYAMIASAIGIDKHNMSRGEASYQVIKYIRNLSRKIGIPSLRDTAFQPEDAMQLAINAMSDTCVNDNPRTPMMEEVREIYMQAYHGDRWYD